MADTPRVVVLKATDHLAERLQPIISDRLSPLIGGSPWTELLKELDALNGHRQSEIIDHDLHSQLRVLTEKLGGLQYPFDDEMRTVSTIASDLRAVRRNLVSNAPFSWLEAWRATDLSVRLLEALADDDGVLHARESREYAFRAYAESTGSEPQVVQTAQPEQTTLPEGVRTPVSSPAHIAPPPKSPREAVRSGGDRLTFEPWPGRQAGDVAVLNSLGRRESRAQVEALAGAIVDYEWPVSIERLSREVVRCFGLKRVNPDRLKKVQRAILKSGVHLDEDGFVWPSAEDSKTWTAFRYDLPETARTFDNISLQEIRNAIVEVRRTYPNLRPEEQKLKVLNIFGRERRTKGVAQRFDIAWVSL